MICSRYVWSINFWAIALRRSFQVSVPTITSTAFCKISTQLLLPHPATIVACKRCSRRALIFNHWNHCIHFRIHRWRTTLTTFILQDRQRTRWSRPIHTHSAGSYRTAVVPVRMPSRTLCWRRTIASHWPTRICAPFPDDWPTSLPRRPSSSILATITFRTSSFFLSLKTCTRLYWTETAISMWTRFPIYPIWRSCG